MHVRQAIRYANESYKIWLTVQAFADFRTLHPSRGSCGADIVTSKATHVALIVLIACLALDDQYYLMVRSTKLKG